MKMPQPRGPLSAAVIDRLTLGVDERDTGLVEQADATIAGTVDVLADGDLQLSLFLLYALWYDGIDGVDDRLEWDPGLLATRARLEAASEAALRRDVVVPAASGTDAESVARTLFALTAEESGPSLSRHVARHATKEQAIEFVVHRSIYQLREADPHTWAIPRLHGRPKAALVEVQADEYGGGRPELMHAELFALTMRGLGLNDRYGEYVDLVPGITLASVNMMSMFGLHRRLRGAICGHLAAFEMTSSIPNRFYGNGFRRLGYDSDTTWYFDEHVEADAVHEQIAGRDLAGGLVEQEPELLHDVLFGAAACLYLDGRVGSHLLDAWAAGGSSLRAALVLAA